METVTHGHIRWMIRRDMPEVLAIEEERFPWCWGEENLLYHLRQRNCIGMVVEVGDTVVGYMVYELHDDYLQVINFAVGAIYQRKGYGSRMIDKLKNKLYNRRHFIRIDVPELSLDMQVFLREHGFHVSSIDGDVYCMEYERF